MPDCILPEFFEIMLEIHIPALSYFDQQTRR